MKQMTEQEKKEFEAEWRRDQLKISVCVVASSVVFGLLVGASWVVFGLLIAELC